MTTGDADHPLGYYGVIADFYDESAERLAKHLDAGRTVVVLAEGDPLFYSSYMYLHDRLAGQFRCEIVPGVTSMTAAAAGRRDTAGPARGCAHRAARHPAGTGAGSPAGRHRRRGDHEAGPTFHGVREALRQAGRLESARYVERATTGGEHTWPVAEVDPRSVPYFSMIIVPGADRRQDSAGRQPPTAPLSRSRAPTRPEPVAKGRAPSSSASDPARPRGSPQRYRRRWPKSITSWAMALIVDRVPARPDFSGTPAETPWSWTEPGSLSIWPERRAGGCGLRRRRGGLRHGLGRVRGGG